MLGVWCLLKGLQCLMNLNMAATFEKTKEASSKVKPAADGAALKGRDSAQLAVKSGSPKVYALMYTLNAFRYKMISFIIIKF